MSRPKTNSVSVRWHEGNQQWITAKGYRWNKARTKIDKAIFYLGKEQDKAIVKAQHISDCWKVISEEWGTVKASLSPAEYPCLDKPFWTVLPNLDSMGEEKKQIQEIARQEKILPTSDYTVGQAKTDYLKYKQSRIKPTSLNSLSNHLKYGLACGGIFTEDRLLGGFTSKDISDFITSLLGLSSSLRTRRNYGIAVKGFIDWMKRQERYQAFNPMGLENEFQDFLTKTSGANPLPIVPTDEEIKALIQACGLDNRYQKTKAFVLLALNCGMYPADISDLKPTDIIKENGVSYVVWKRSKTRHQNRDLIIKHPLWKETLEAITAHRTDTGERLFLNADGKPLERTEGRNRLTSICQSFTSLASRAKVDISFKQLRKYAGSKIANIHSVDISRFFLGQVIEGVASQYIQQEQSKMEQAMGIYHKKLKDTGIL